MRKPTMNDRVVIRSLDARDGMLDPLSSFRLSFSIAWVSSRKCGSAWRAVRE